MLAHFVNEAFEFDVPLMAVIIQILLGKIHAKCFPCQLAAFFQHNQLDTVEHLDLISDLLEKLGQIGAKRGR